MRYQTQSIISQSEQEIALLNETKDSVIVNASSVNAKANIELINKAKIFALLIETKS